MSDNSFFTDDGVCINEDERMQCEIWTRVMGYHRPVSQYNKGKKSEYDERTCFEV